MIYSVLQFFAWIAESLAHWFVSLIFSVEVLVLIGAAIGIRYWMSRWLVTDLALKNVVITGCDTGFGKMLALQLASRGVKVYAGCLTAKGLDDLTQIAKDSRISSSLSTFLLDVTSEKSIQDAFDSLMKTECAQGIYALVNNAGVLRGGPLDVSTIDDLRLQLNVNVVGLAAVTRYFLPLLRKSKGRIVNVTSVAGRYAATQLSYYHASKFAAVGMNDSFRQELSPWGIKVISIEPGIMKTPLWDVATSEQELDKSWNRMTPDQQKLYGKDYFVKGRKASIDFVNSYGGDPQMVVDTMESAVLSQYPFCRYVVGLDANFIFVPLSFLPSPISDRLWRAVSPESTPAALLNGGN